MQLLCNNLKFQLKQGFVKPKLVASRPDSTRSRAGWSSAIEQVIRLYLGTDRYLTEKWTGFRLGPVLQYVYMLVVRVRVHAVASSSTRT